MLLFQLLVLDSGEGHHPQHDGEEGVEGPPPRCRLRQKKKTKPSEGCRCCCCCYCCCCKRCCCCSCCSCSCSCCRCCCYYFSQELSSSIYRCCCCYCCCCFYHELFCRIYPAPVVTKMFTLTLFCAYLAPAITELLESYDGKFQRHKEEKIHSAYMRRAPICAPRSNTELRPHMPHV